MQVKGKREPLRVFRLVATAADSSAADGVDQTSGGEEVT
jgi:hypothetical protein